MGKNRGDVSTGAQTQDVLSLVQLNSVYF